MPDSSSVRGFDEGKRDARTFGIQLPRVHQPVFCGRRVAFVDPASMSAELTSNGIDGKLARIGCASYMAPGRAAAGRAYHFRTTAASPARRASTRPTAKVSTIHAAASARFRTGDAGGAIATRLAESDAFELAMPTRCGLPPIDCRRGGAGSPSNRRQSAAQVESKFHACGLCSHNVDLGFVDDSPMSP
jgi:hypothetical protein